MSDQGVAFARALLESADELETDDQGRLQRGAIRRFLDREFPGISQADVQRGFEIAVELATIESGAP